MLRRIEREIRKQEIWGGGPRKRKFTKSGVHAASKSMTSAVCECETEAGRSKGSIMVCHDHYSGLSL